MKPIIFVLFTGLLFGCSQEKTQSDTKGPDTVVVVQQPAPVHTSSTNTQTPPQKKDIIDKTNDAIDKTNKTVTRTSETIDKANELKKKTDELINK